MNRLSLPVTWPLVLAFAFYPLWWLLGIGSFTWILFAAPMVVGMIARKWTKAPPVVFIWMLFLAWVLMSGLQLHGGTRILTFTYRFLLYAGSTAFFLYIYNLPRTGRYSARVLRILTIFWILVVFFGYLGILLKSFTFTPPFAHLIPGSLRNKPFTQELVVPVFAEVQHFLGFPVPRPSAPFAYTNQWGATMAVLTPVGLAAITSAGPGPRRKLLIAVLAAQIVPMVFSLNRGMFLCVGLGLIYLAIRLAARGNGRALATIVGVALAAVILIFATPLGGLVSQSFHSTHGNSNATRLSVYAQSVSGVNQSPLFGYGAPQSQAGETSAPAIGTQGQLWMVLYSNGYPAIALFVLFFLTVAWQTRKARGTAGLCLHAVPLVGIAEIAFYGWLPGELQLVMAVCALAYRQTWAPVPSLPAALPAGDAAGDQPPARPRVLAGLAEPAEKLPAI